MGNRSLRNTPFNKLQAILNNLIKVSRRAGPFFAEEGFIRIPTPQILSSLRRQNG
jgi:aspartyl/asparaginyl-tRNA synthetase